MIPHRVYLEIYPDMDFEVGQDNTRTMNLRSPGIRVHVFRGKLDLGQTVLRTGETFEVEGLGLRFAEIRYWGEFSVLRDPGAPILFAGFLLALVGLTLKLLTSRKGHV
jgi:hypothetical protein